jgi:hypothetical protein
VELPEASGTLKVPGLAILAPSGGAGGAEGAAVIDLVLTLEELRRRARRQRGEQ